VSSQPGDLAGAAAVLAAALAGACADPADQLRLLEQLAAFTPAAPASTTPIGAAVADMTDAMGDLFRRTAVIALATAATNYQPSSQTDAYAVMNTVTGLLDSEIEIAGDQGEDDSYNALRALRTAVVQDLTARGASLAPIATFKFGAPLPALYLAQRLYRDPSRADQLVTQVNPVHPLFMPARFAALAF
jgi:prophage DNA circulation protein